MENLINQNEEIRKMAVKFIVFSKGQYMCATNWSNSYSAGVVEFASKEEALVAAISRTKDDFQLYGYNFSKERIL